MQRWQDRHAICVECRTLTADTTCTTNPSHHVASLHDHESRELVLTAVWGPKSLRRRVGEAVKVGATGGAGAGFLDSCSGCDFGGFDLEGLAAFAIVAIAIGFIYFFGKAIYLAVQRRRKRLTAQGASRKGLELGPETGRVGTVIADKRAPLPLRSSNGVAYALELRSRRTVMLRDSQTLGFEVVLDTGERVRVPAGPCVIDLDRGERVTTGVDKYREAIDPLRVETNDLDPFPFEHAVTASIRHGDRVEVLGRLVPDAMSGESGYRDMLVTRLVPDGVPRLRGARQNGRASSA